MNPHSKSKQYFTVFLCRLSICTGRATTGGAGRATTDAAGRDTTGGAG